MRKLVCLILLGLIACPFVAGSAVVATNVTVMADPNYATAVPNVTATNATDITNTSALLHGNVTDNHGGEVTLRGFEWGLSSSNYSWSWNQTGNWTTGTFSHTIESLSVDVEYYWRAFAENAVGRGNSTELSFTTLGIPLAPTNFTIVRTGSTTANLTWTRGVAANTTYIRVSDAGCPGSLTGGWLVYNGTGTEVAVDGLDLNTNTYCFWAWSWNENGFSTDYAQDSISGGNMVATAIFLFLALGFTGMFFWKRIGLLAYGAAGSWAVGAFQCFQTSGSSSPVNITDVWMALFWMCIALVLGMALMPTVMRPKPEKEERKERPSRFDRSGQL